MCCTDDSCECYRNGIECQLGTRLECGCGGNVVYNNVIGDDWKWNKSGFSKKNSLCCANPNGNTLKLIVTEYKGDPQKGEHEVVKVADDESWESGDFNSFLIQKKLSDWNDYYDSNDDDIDDNKDSVDGFLQKLSAEDITELLSALQSEHGIERLRANATGLLSVSVWDLVICDGGDTT